MANGEITSLSIPVLSNADEVAREFSRLASAARRLRDASGVAAGGMRDMADAAKEDATETSKVADQSGEAQKKVRGFGEGAKGAGDNAKKGANGISIFWNAMKRVGSVSFKGIKGALFDLPRYFGGKLLDNVKQAVGGIGQFFSSLKRIAFYRAIRSALKLITQGFSEGMKNLYAWSSAVNGSFAASMDKLATASLYLKNSFAAMVSPLVEALAPAVDFVVDKFVNLFNVINQVFAVLAGKTSYTAAKKVAQQWQDTSDKASSSARRAANEIKRTILGFDEINKLNGDNGRNSGSGSGANNNNNNAALMFENRSISSWITDMVNGGDYSALGKKIAEKINDALGKINWSSIQSTAFGISDSITSLLNGFIEDIDPNVLGESLANVINVAVSTIDRFWSSTEWDIAGQKLRAAIVKFFENVDAETAAKAVTAPFKSIVTLIYNAIPKTQSEWNTIGSKISTFINTAVENIPWSTIGDAAGELLVGALKTMTILADDMTLTHIAEGIKTAIQSALDNITVQDVTDWVSAVLKDVLSAVSVLMSINIDFNGFKISPLTVIAFGLAARSTLSSLVSSIFGGNAGGIASSAKGLAFTAGIVFAIEAVANLVGIINGIKDDGTIKWENVAGFLKGAALSTGMFLLAKGHYKAGVVALGIGLVIEPVVNKIVDIVNDIKENGFSADTFWDIMQTVLSVAGLALISAGANKLVGMFSAKIGVKLGLASVGMETAAGAAGGFFNTTAFRGAIMSVLSKFFSTVFGGSFASLLIVGGGIVLGLSIGAAIGITPEIDKEYSDRVFANNPTDPASIYNDPLMGGNGIYAPTNTAADPTMVADITVNANPGKNMTSAGGKLKPDVSNTSAVNKVNAVAGTGMGKGFFGGIAALVKDTSTTNTVITKIGKGMQEAGGKIQPIVANTVTTNTINGNPGTVMEWSNNSVAAVVSDTNSLNIVNASAGVGMSGTNSYSLSADVSDTRTSNVVDALAGSGMTAQGYGMAPVVENARSTVDVDMWTPWQYWGVSALRWMGLENLRTSVTVDIVTGAVRGAVGGLLAGFNRRAKGGVYVNGGWSDIPQYAGGTTNAGSLFMAGEAGPEIVGHVGGRTEVLNKSQIASAIYSAVQAAMAPATSYFAAAAQSINDSSVSFDLEMLAEMVRQGVEQAMSRSNDLDRQRNEYLRQINDKDYSVDVSTSSINRSQNRMNRRAGTTIVPVGT